MKQIRSRHSVIGMAGVLGALFLLGSRAGSDDPELMLRRVVRDSELVVRGVITSVGSTTVPYDSLFNWVPVTKPGVTHPVTTIEVRISHVIKGSWQDQTITAVLSGAPKLGGFTFGVFYDYHVGEEVILCLRYHLSILGGAFQLWTGTTDTFVNLGGSWMNRDVPARGVSLAVIMDEAKATEPAAMVREADAVVLGSIEAVRRKEFDCGFALMCAADYATVRVTRAWKGATTGDVMLIRAIRIGTNLPWYTAVPQLTAGETYLMFLKRDEVGFYPFVGFNGFLKVEGDDLIMIGTLNGKLRYPLSRTAMSTRVEEEVGP